ncbi:hypothetical protein KYC5002_00715 [Archangium violaceum]|uniref:hypothetical protein n=1 Tax=Archangium violaceum TaxID=83451 RepID=UPI002B3167C6|nr:hypothetical protein KYC5002_00715 [Archangium gephyra]
MHPPRPGALHRALVASTGPSFGCRFLAPLALLHRARGSAACPGVSTAPELRLPRPGALHRARGSAAVPSWPPPRR